MRGINIVMGRTVFTALNFYNPSKPRYIHKMGLHEWENKIALCGFLLRINRKVVQPETYRAIWILSNLIMRVFVRSLHDDILNLSENELINFHVSNPCIYRY